MHRRSTEIPAPLEDLPEETVSYLLRLVVPDRPGILGAVATALGAAGVDIVSLDVLERGGGVAVDDIVVDLPPDRLPDSLITAVTTVRDVEVESLRPFAGPLDTHRELELLEALAHATTTPPEPSLALKLLAAELPRVFSSGWAAVLEAGPAGGAPEVLAASDGAPSFQGVALPWLPLSGPRLLPSEEDWLPERWQEMAVEMMAAPYGDGGAAVVVGRSGGPAFRRSELLRLVHLVGIAATVAHLPPA
jgi:ACT domain